MQGRALFRSGVTREVATHVQASESVRDAVLGVHDTCLANFLLSPPQVRQLPAPCPLPLWQAWPVQPTAPLAVLASPAQCTP